MNTLIMSVAAALTLFAGYAPALQAEDMAENVARDAAGYPAEPGFPPMHHSWRSPVMTYDAYRPFPGPMMSAPAWSRYGSGGTAYPGPDGFPPGHLYAPSTVMNPGSMYIYPQQQLYRFQRWR